MERSGNMNAYRNLLASNDDGGTMIKLSFLSLSVLLFAMPVAAHHSGVAYFDLDASVEHTDVTVVSYELVNPHGRLVYTFTDENGNEVQWSGEMPSANNARRRGLGGEIFKPGAQLTSVMGSPARSGSNFMRLERVVFPNGDVAQISGRNAGITRAGQ
jgi:hypothetical protein